MNYGMYISAMGVQVQEYRQAVAANNLANAQTNGFKRAIANVQARPNAAVEDPAMRAYRVPVYGQMNGGVWAQPTGMDLTQGTLVTSASKTDVALEGDGFFTVQGDNKETLLTRDGKFLVNSDGELVTANAGRKVLDSEGAAIKLNPTLPVDIGPKGEVTQGDATVATLGVVKVSGPEAIEPIGGNALRVRPGFKTQPAGDETQVRSGYTEQSGVDPIVEMVSMIEGQRVFEANARMISMQDTMLQQVNAIGRIA